MTPAKVFFQVQDKERVEKTAPNGEFVSLETPVGKTEAFANICRWTFFGLFDYGRPARSLISHLPEHGTAIISDHGCGEVVHVSRVRAYQTPEGKVIVGTQYVNQV